MHLLVAVLGLDVVGEGLGLLKGRVVVVVVMVVVVLGTNVLHLVDAAALGATLDGAVAGHLGRRSVIRHLRRDPVQNVHAATRHHESQRGIQCNRQTAHRRPI